MKTTLKLFTGALLAGFVGAAQALPITDTYTPDAPVTLTTGVPYFYVHSLLTHGFVPALDTLASATLTLSITGPDGQPISLSLDGTTLFNDALSVLLAGLTVDLAYLQSDGVLNVTLTKGGGRGSTFTFLGSTLFAEGVTGGNEEPGGSPTQTSPVPEPTILALLGIGLLASLLVRRREG